MSALEFLAPLNVGATNFNRNPRKFRILQAQFPDSQSLEPLVIGTYFVDPSTGQIQSQFLPQPTISQTGSGVTGVATQTITNLKQPFRIDRIWLGSDTAQYLSLSLGPSSGFAFWQSFIQANQTILIDYTEYGGLLVDGVHLGAIGDTEIILNYTGADKVSLETETH